MINRSRRERNRFYDECYALQIECEKTMTRIKCNVMESQLKKKQDEITILKNKNFQLNQDYMYLYKLFHEKKSYYLHHDKLENAINIKQQDEISKLNKYLKSIYDINIKQKDRISRLNIDLDYSHEIIKDAIEVMDQTFDMYMDISDKLAQKKNEIHNLNTQLINQQNSVCDFCRKHEHAYRKLREKFDQLCKESEKCNSQNTSDKTDITKEEKEEKEADKIIQSDHEKDDDLSELPKIDISKLITTTKITNDLHDEEFDIFDYDE
jgi:hypothetical protein